MFPKERHDGHLDADEQEDEGGEDVVVVDRLEEGRVAE